MNEEKTEVLFVHKFINDYMIQNKRIKPLAFNLFHRCQLKCYKNSSNDESQVYRCNQACQKSKIGSSELDDFIVNCRVQNKPKFDDEASIQATQTNNLKIQE